MSIPRDLIDPEAEKIVRRLHRYGHQAYLVGGCVRDLLLGRTPKDFDVATSATPTEVKDLFRNCRIIGRRFRLAHIFFGSKIIETSTFRANPREVEDLEESDELLIRRDNVFGTAEEDARRRDFTINGLFYDLERAEVIDFVGGLADLQSRLVRTIGDPDIRFREDPVRILRAVKFAARLGFAIEPATYAAMLAHRAEIPKCAPPRVLEEIYRLLRGAARRSMELLLETKIAAVLSSDVAWLYGGDAALVPGPDGTAPTPPPVSRVALAADVERHRTLAWRTLDEVDAANAAPPAAVPASTREPAGAGRRPRGRALEPQPSNALLLSVLVAPFLPEAPPSDDGRARDAFELVDELLTPVVQSLRVSRRDAERARQILLARRRLAPTRRRRSRPMVLVKRDYFAEALALYEIVARSSDTVGDEIAHWRSLAQRAGLEPAAPRSSEAAPRSSEAAPRSSEAAPRSSEAAPRSSEAAPDDAAADAEERTGRRRRRRGGRRRRRHEGEAPPSSDGAPAGGGRAAREAPARPTAPGREAREDSPTMAAASGGGRDEDHGEP